MPGPGRNGAPPNPDLIPANNPVLRPPVAGKIGLWAKTDSTSYFKDYVVSPTMTTVMLLLALAQSPNTAGLVVTVTDQRRGGRRREGLRAQHRDRFLA